VRGRIVKMIRCFVLLVASVLFCSGELPVISSQLDVGIVSEKRAGYDEVVGELEGFRVAQAKIYRDGSEGVKKEVLMKVKNRLEGDLCDGIFPAWYGTTWAFSGISKVPGEGEVACGYFVSNCLLHMGFRVQRIKLAQQVSQKIINTMTSGKKSISAGWKMDRVLKGLDKTGDGVYIVGLDTHVGFVIKKGDVVRFVHSNYYRSNRMVVCEEAVGSNPLNDSNYRVFGKLFDNVMLVKWLEGAEFRVK